MSIFLKDAYGNSRLTARQIVKDPRLLLAFGFGAGLAKVMPGTFGTLAAVPLYWLLSRGGIELYSIVTVLAVVGGCHLCDYAADKLQVHDFGGIVWDEVAGLLIAMWFVPVSWQSLACGFALFRLFDIVKPWPIKWVDRKVHGGFGIMLDDILAGLLAALVLHWLFGAAG